MSIHDFLDYQPDHDVDDDDGRCPACGAGPDEDCDCMDDDE